MQNGVYGIEVVTPLNKTVDPALPKDHGIIEDAIRLLQHSQTQANTARPFFLQVIPHAPLHHRF